MLTAGVLGTDSWLLGLAPQRSFSRKARPAPAHPDWLQTSLSGSSLLPAELQPQALCDHGTPSPPWPILTLYTAQHTPQAFARPVLCWDVLWLPTADIGDQELEELRSSPVHFTSWLPSQLPSTSTSQLLSPQCGLGLDSSVIFSLGVSQPPNSSPLAHLRLH